MNEERVYQLQFQRRRSRSQNQSWKEIRCETAVRAQAVFDGVEFPAGIANLDTSLSNMDGDDFTHYRST